MRDLLFQHLVFTIQFAYHFLELLFLLQNIILIQVVLGFFRNLPCNYLLIIDIHIVNLCGRLIKVITLRLDLGILILNNSVNITDCIFDAKILPVYSLEETVQLFVALYFSKKTVLDEKTN